MHQPLTLTHVECVRLGHGQIIHHPRRRDRLQRLDHAHATRAVDHITHDQRARLHPARALDEEGMLRRRLDQLAVDRPFKNHQVLACQLRLNS